jgi:hypothetical protein
MLRIAASISAEVLARAPRLHCSPMMFRALLLACVAACGSPSPDRPPTARDADLEDVTSWPPAGGIRPRFAWTPMILERKDVDEELGTDGQVTRKVTPSSQIVVTADPAGGVQISSREDVPTADADAFERALWRSYGLLRIVTRQDGQIDHLAGVDEFVAAVKADPESAESRALFDKPGMREIIEATVEKNYVAWIVTWLDAGWVPEPGRHVRWRNGELAMTIRSDDLGAEAPGRVRLRFRIEGPGPKISVHRTFLSDLLPSERFAESTGYYQIELVTDPRTLVPVRAVIERELRAGGGADQVRGWKRMTTTFTAR